MYATKKAKRSIFDTLRLTRVVVVVSCFSCECSLPNKELKRNWWRLGNQGFAPAVVIKLVAHLVNRDDDGDDVLWAWTLLFRGVCDKHAPPKEIKRIFAMDQKLY